MTAIINTNFQTLISLDPVTRNCDQNSAPKSYSRDQTRNSQTFHSQNCFSVIIKQVHCPYVLLFTLNTTSQITCVKIHLLKSNGNLLKITSQQSKTYLIKKFHLFNDLYTPRIDPCTGAIYFDLHYFELKGPQSKFHETDLKILYDNLNQEKLYQSIQKFSLFYQDGEQNNWGETDFEVRKKYQQLSKTICAVNDSDLMHIQSINQHANKENNEQNAQKEQKSEFISHLKHFLSAQKYSPQPCNKRLISKQIKQIEFEAGNVSTLTKRKHGKSNYDTLLVNHTTQKQIREVIFKMAETKALRTSLKVVESELGKITLNIEKQEESIYRAKMRFLNHMPKNTEYHFLDMYFKNPDTLPVMISLSLKEESIHRYLINNALCISFETKMRILLQICSAVHTLWEQKNIILNVNSFKRIHITKNLTIKLRNLASFSKIDPHMMLEEKAEVNMRLLENWLNLSELYFKLFYGFDIGFVRPAANSQVGIKSTEFMKSTIMAKRAVGQKLVPEGFQDPTKQMLVGMNYIFVSFIHKAGKIMTDPHCRKRRPRQMCGDMKSILERQHELDKTKRLLSYKLMCCWLFKNFEMITSESL